jgi:hypothetical protein
MRTISLREAMQKLCLELRAARHPQRQLRRFHIHLECEPRAGFVPTADIKEGNRGIHEARRDGGLPGHRRPGAVLDAMRSAQHARDYLQQQVAGSWWAPPLQRQRQVAYQAVCKEEPSLQAFDLALQYRSDDTSWFHLPLFCRIGCKGAVEEARWTYLVEAVSKEAFLYFLEVYTFVF